jgi:hypothetical protein
LNPRGSGAGRAGTNLGLLALDRVVAGCLNVERTSTAIGDFRMNTVAAEFW